VTHLLLRPGWSLVRDTMGERVAEIAVRSILSQSAPSYGADGECDSIMPRGSKNPRAAQAGPADHRALGGQCPCRT
jgi:hypothetical protein